MIGKIIKFHRIKLGIKQSELAEKIGMSKAIVAMWETDKRNPTIYALKKLAEIFGCTTDELLEPIETNVEQFVDGQTAERTDEDE